MWVTLPLDDTPCLEMTSLQANVKEDNPLTVLYIEDNQMNLEVMEAMLEEVLKVQLMVALSGKEGIELAVSKRPDLIFLDLRLPDIDGIDVLKSLKQNKITVTIPVVIVTANVMSEDKQHLMELGASAYLEKPIEFQVLKSLMITFKNDIVMSRKIDNRNEPLRYEFVEPLDCQFKIIEINNEKVNSNTANAKLIDLSQNGMKIETELEIPIDNIRVFLEVSFIIIKEKYEIQCMMIWSKSLGNRYQYGLKFDHQEEFVEHLMMDMKFYAKQHSL